MCDAQGRSIHQFHKDPERIRNIFRALTTGTTRERSTELVLGGVTFALSFTPISSAEGKVLAFHASLRAFPVTSIRAAVASGAAVVAH
ncbi:MAG: hypothetical protein WBX19_11110 [Terracidiphilus sp.]